jgi:hypothetical protein
MIVDQLVPLLLLNWSSTVEPATGGEPALVHVMLCVVPCSHFWPPSGDVSVRPLARMLKSAALVDVNWVKVVEVTLTKHWVDGEFGTTHAYELPEPALLAVLPVIVDHEPPLLVLS